MAKDHDLTLSIKDYMRDPMIFQFLKFKRRNSCLKKSHSIAESVQETNTQALRPKFELGQLKKSSFIALAVVPDLVTHLLRAIEEFRKLNVGFVSITESIDTNTPLGAAVFTILGAVAQLERDLIAERVHNGFS